MTLNAQCKKVNKIPDQQRSFAHVEKMLKKCCDINSDSICKIETNISSDLTLIHDVDLPVINLLQNV